MEIKDFTPGQTAYALMTRRGKTTEHFVMRYTVTKVGRKYVSSTKTPGGGYEEQFFKQREEDEYLTEKEDWGSSRLKLFLTEQATTDYIEKTMLCTWFKQATAYGEIEKYTLNQLRAVRDILEKKNDRAEGNDNE